MINMENRDYDMTMTPILSKYQYQKPKDFGDYTERCYPVSAVMDMLKQYSLEQNKQLLDEIERLKTNNRILKDELEDLDKQYSVLNEQFVKTKEWNLEIVYSNKFKDNEIEMLKFQLKAADSVNEQKDNKWISVEDRLPEDDEPILGYNNVSLKQFTVIVTAYDGKVFRCFDDTDDSEDIFEYGTSYPKITHWMPLPNQPK